MDQNNKSNQPHSDVSRAASNQTLIFAIVIFAVLMVIGAAMLITQKPASTTPTIRPTISEDLRPATGSVTDVNLTNDDIQAARSAMNGSFIGIAACTLNTNWHLSFANGAKAAAEAMGINAEIGNPETDVNKQLQIIRDFTKRGAKGLVVCILDVNTIMPALQEAQTAGVIITAAMDTPLGMKSSVVMSLRNSDMGKGVGLYTADLVNKELNGKANVAILDYPSVPAVVERASAMRDTLLSKAPNVNIVGNYQGGLTADGEKNMTDAIKQHPEINVIMSINDAGSYGAVMALQAAGKKPSDVIIVSVDAEDQARQMIRDHQFIRATFSTGPDVTSALGVKSIAKILAGGVVPKQIFMSGGMVDASVLAQTLTPPTRIPIPTTASTEVATDEMSATAAPTSAESPPVATAAVMSATMGATSAPTQAQ